MLAGLVMNAIAFGGVWTAVSLCAVGIGVYLLLRDRHRRARWIRVPGRIIRSITYDEGGGNISYQPEVQFRAAGRDEDFRVSGNTWYATPQWEIGDERSVRYDPDHPAEAFLDDLTGAGFVGRMLLALGSVLTLMGTFFLASGVFGSANPVVRFFSRFFGD
jgi:hypothetical protein